MMGEAKRKLEADCAGVPRPRDECCPACGSKRIADLPEDGLRRFDVTVPWQVCLACSVVWEPFPPVYVRDPVCAEPCDNCAFRPGSPEQRDPERWRELMSTLRGNEAMETRFFCHKGVPIDLTKGPGNFNFPRRPVTIDGEVVKKPDGSALTTWDTNAMRTCSGYLRMFWARQAKQEKGTADAELP
jgi:hypothetical protein